MNMLRYHQDWIKCANCLKESRFPVYDLDGYLLMRNPENKADCRLLNWRDAAFNEVANLAKKYKKQIVAELIQNPLHKTVITNTVNAEQQVFSIVCDLSVGVRYSFDVPAVCPHCHSHDISGWGPTNNPYETIEAEFPDITHHHWDQLTEDQKDKIVSDEVRRLVQIRLDELAQD